MTLLLSQLEEFFINREEDSSLLIVNNRSLFQNLESSLVSRQYAALLLDATLDDGKWELSKDLVRFFRAIGLYLMSENLKEKRNDE